MRKEKLWSSAKTKLLLDIGLAGAFVVAMEPRFTGETWHEWLGLGLLAAIVVHLLLNWKWIVQVTRRFLSKLNSQTRINYLLNSTLFLAFLVTMVSGILISRTLGVAEALGIEREGLQTWERLHHWSPNLLLIVVGLHIAMHWKWVVVTFKRLLPKHLPSLKSPFPSKIVSDAS